MNSSSSEYSDVVNRQTWVRIKIAVAAIAYEMFANPIMSDAEFDKLCLEVDVTVKTRRPDLDKWFKENFNPSTGSWVWKHPEKSRLIYLYELWKQNETPT